MMSNDVLVDDSALLALGSGNRLMSGLVASGRKAPGRHVYAPAMCIASAIAQRPEIGDHVGALDAIHVLDLGFTEAHTAGLAIAAGLDWGQAHALAAARPSVEWPTGLQVITQHPDAYVRQGIEVIDLS